MKKIIQSIAFALILPAVCHAVQPYDKVTVSTTTRKATQKFSGDYKVFATIDASTTSFEINGGSITKCGTIDGRDVSALGTSVDNLAVSTGSIQTQLDSVFLATASIQGVILSSSNTWTAPQTFASSITVQSPIYATTTTINGSLTLNTGSMTVVGNTWLKGSRTQFGSDSNTFILDNGSYLQFRHGGSNGEMLFEPNGTCGIAVSNRNPSMGAATAVSVGGYYYAGNKTQDDTDPVLQIKRNPTAYVYNRTFLKLCDLSGGSTGMVIVSTGMVVSGRFIDISNSVNGDSYMVVDGTGTTVKKLTSSGLVNAASMTATGYITASSITVTGQYTLPTVDGNDGEYMTTDGDGGVTWANISGTLADGTTAHNTIKWNGASWVETDALKVFTSSAILTQLNVSSITLTNLSSLFKFKLGTSAVPATVGNSTITGVGFTPRIIIVGLTYSMGVDTSMLGLGWATSPTVGGNVLSLHVASAENYCFGYSANNIIAIPTKDGSWYVSCHLHSIDADGFTLHWDGVGAGGGPTFTYLAIQ